jgi:lipopolysaccharide transport system permease protein
VKEMHFGPVTQWWRLPIKELMGSGTLFGFLLWKEIRVRYKQTSVGILWIVLQPLLEMAIFTLIFGHLFERYSNIPYPLFVYAGLAPWMFFSSGISSATSSFVSHADMIKKIYFPRFIIPLAIVLSKGVDFLVAFLVLMIMMFLYGVQLTPLIALFPALFLLLYLLTAGISLWTATLHGLYRDVGLIVPYFLRIGIFLTPVIYPLHSIHERWQNILAFNPLSGIILAFRSVMLGMDPVPWGQLGIDALVVFVIFVSGLFFFRKMEHRLLDVI